MPPKPQEWGEFVRAFNGIARHRHRYEVFRDFVTLSALSAQNSMRDFMPADRYQALETEYLATVKRYDKEEATEFARLFARVVFFAGIRTTPSAYGRRSLTLTAPSLLSKRQP